MIMRRRRFLTALPALLLALICLTPGARAAEAMTPLADFAFALDEEAGTVLLTSYNGSGTSVVVPGSFALDGKEYETVVASGTIFRGNEAIKSVRLCGGIRFQNDSMRNLFRGCAALTEIDLSETNTTGVTDMGLIFYQCSSLQSLDVSSFDTSAVTTIRGIFAECSKLKTLTGYENWDTGNVLDMYFAFERVGYGYSNGGPERIDLRNWDLSNVRNTGWCFQMCRAKEILLPDSLAVMSAGFLNHATKVTGEIFTIPAGVKKIGYAHTIYDFSNDDFKEFKVAEGNAYYQAIDGILYSADGTEMLAVPRGKVFENDTYMIPEGVTFLGELSFSRNYNVHRLILPDSYEIVYVPVYDERYIVEDDIGNLNPGTNLSIAIYCYTGVTEYDVKETNPRYTARDGVIYSKDGTHLVAVPARYAQPLVLPEGVTHWDMEAMWAEGSSTVDNLLSNCAGVNVPASLVSISDDQLAMLNRLRADRAGTDHPFTLSVAENNPVFAMDENGDLVRMHLAIVRQPEDAQADVGERVSVSVEASGEELRYQWYGRNPGEKLFWKSSIKSDVYSVTMNTARAGRELYCVVTDKYGNAVQTETVTLGLMIPEDYRFGITTQPESAYALPGEPVVVRLEAEGAGLTYQWYLKNAGSENWSLSSIKKNSYSVTMTNARDGRLLYCVVTDKYGSVVQSDTITIGYDYPDDYTPPAITVQPRDVFVDAGEMASTSIEATGTGLTYQWYLRDPGAEKFGKSSLKSDTYSVKMVPAKSGREVYCVVTDAYGKKAVSDTAALQMSVPDDYALKIASQPESCAVRENEIAVAAVQAEGEELTFRWYGRDPGEKRFWKSSIKKSVYSVKMVPEKSGRELYCVITDKYGNTVTSETITLTLIQ